MVSTQASISQAMDQIQTHRYSLSVTTPTVDYLDNAEWILDTGATIMYARTEPDFLALRN